MLIVAHYQRNAKQNYNELSPHTDHHQCGHQNGHHQKVYSLQTNAGKGVEKREPSGIAGGNVNGYSHYGRWYGDYLRN